MLECIHLITSKSKCRKQIIFDVRTNVKMKRDGKYVGAGVLVYAIGDDMRRYITSAIQNVAEGNHPRREKNNKNNKNLRKKRRERTKS